MAGPRFSIVICNYDYGRFVEDAVRSCLAQDYPAGEREVIVVDDGSTDDSRDRLAALADTADITVVHQPNAGQASAFATGVARARGDLVCFLDSDDWFAPDKLARVDAHVATLGADTGNLVLMHDYQSIDDATGAVVESSFFATFTPSPGEGVALSRPDDPVYVPIPCGQVYGRPLVQRVCDALPSADWRQGADVVIAHGALLVARRLHYLPEVLATYRLHGDNAMGGVEGTRKITKTSVRARWPKRLWFLEKLTDVLDDGPDARGERLAYIQRFERAVRSVNAARRLPEPVVSLVVDGAGGAEREATLASIAAQTHGAVEALVVGAPPPAGIAAGGPARTVPVEEGACRLARLGAGFEAARGEFIGFVEAGDTLDPMFCERHLASLQHDPPAMASFCDLRILGPSGAVQHAGPLHATSVWAAPARRAGPFDDHMVALRLPPLAAALVRRSPMLGLLLARGASEHGRAVGERALWLVPRYADALGGRIEISECLMSRPVADPVAALWANRSIVPDERGRPVAEPDLSDAALLLLEVYCDEYERFCALYDELWRARFVTWLGFGHAPAAMARLESYAREHGDEDTQDLLGAVQELSAQHARKVAIAGGS